MVRFGVGGLAALIRFFMVSPLLTFYELTPKQTGCMVELLREREASGMFRHTQRACRHCIDSVQHLLCFGMHRATVDLV